jgi:cephalosporin-C deacetylase-like acetyl esterase
VSPRLENVRPEFERACALVAGLNPSPQFELVVSGTGAGPYGSKAALSAFLSRLASRARLAPPGPAPGNLAPRFDPAPRQARQLHELDCHNQWLLAESQYTRQKFMAKLDPTSPESFRQSADGYRDFFSRQVIGRFNDPMLPANPRSRKVYHEPKWTGYEVMLDVFPDVSVYGILLLPKDLKPGERRPVVVCQHGLEGRPQDTITGDSQYYHDFAAKLCEQGFITFAPQNLYIFGDRFRTLQRKANPLGKTLYSLIVPQHQQLTDWLKTQPFVAPAQIAFYGLSYGGKTAMRVPPLVTNYCLSICSGDFNEWVWKNASTRSPYSYVFRPEYEIFEFDLGGTFNYAEMAALIAPRPFMVERGHFDSVAPDETVAYEFAKVRYLYEASLGLRNRCVIEWFTGPHTIHGQGTFDFLHEHLNWPTPAASR